MRPFLDMMDQLVTVGRLDDYTNEFVVKRLLLLSYSVKFHNESNLDVSIASCTEKA